LPSTSHRSGEPETQGSGPGRVHVRQPMPTVTPVRRADVAVAVVAICGRRRDLCRRQSHKPQFLVESVAQKRICRPVGGGSCDPRTPRVATAKKPLAAQVFRRTWLFKLVPKVTALQALGSPKIGMSLAIVASEFLLHINHAGGPVGAKPEFATHRSPIEALLLVGPRSGNCKMGH